jgi:hypothetical protein
VSLESAEAGEIAAESGNQAALEDFYELAVKQWKNTTTTTS